MKVTNVNISLKGEPYSGPLFLSAIADMDPDDAKVPYGGQQIKPAENGRAELEWPDCAPAGGANASVYVKGASWSGRQLIPASGACEGISVELEPSEPPFYSREVRCKSRSHFQGLWVHSNAFGAEYQRRYGGYGTIPYYATDYIDFAAAGDGAQIRQQLKDAGDSHVMLYLRNGGHGYNEPGQPYGDDQLIPAFQSWDRFDEWLVMVDDVIRDGFVPEYTLYGEGDDGRQWLWDYLPSLLDRMGDGRIKRGLFTVAFDSVWPGSWSVDDMKKGIPRLRAMLGNDAGLAFWFGKPGNVQYMWVESPDDYKQPWMDGLDVVFTTDGREEAECVSLANKARYLVQNPNFTECQPDKPPLFCLVPNSRGERFAAVKEWLTYECTRDPWQVYKPQVDAARARMIAMNWPAWG